MANPHRDAGYTGIAHELILAMARVGFSGREWDVLMIILRETYGVHIKRAADPKKRWLKENELSSRYISWLTGLHDSAVRHVLRSLEKENVIVVTAGAGKPNVYGINKHYEKWNRKPRPTASPESAPKITKPDSYKNYLRGIRGGSEPSNSSVGEHLLRDTSDPGGGTPATRGEGHQRPGGCDVGDPGGVIPASLQTGLKADNQADFSPPKKGIRRREEEVEEDGSVRIFAARCPYREALQSIRTIFTEKEEQKLLAFRELEAQFPKERILAALKKRVAEAEGFADRGKRTSWILINAQDDLNDSARPAVSHPDDELRR